MQLPPAACLPPGQRSRMPGLRQVTSGLVAAPPPRSGLTTTRSLPTGPSLRRPAGARRSTFMHCRSRPNAPRQSRTERTDIACRATIGLSRSVTKRQLTSGDRRSESWTGAPVGSGWNERHRDATPWYPCRQCARSAGPRLRPARWPTTAPLSGSMALIGHDLPAGPARLPDSARRRLRTAGPATATNNSLPAPAQSSADSRRSGAAAVPRRRSTVRGCRWRYQSLVSLAHGVMIRTRHEPKSTTRAASTSTPMTRPRPYVSWVT